MLIMDGWVGFIFFNSNKEKATCCDDKGEDDIEPLGAGALTQASLVPVQGRYCHEDHIHAHYIVHYMHIT